MAVTSFWPRRTLAQLVVLDHKKLGRGTRRGILRQTDAKVDVPVLRNYFSVSEKSVITANSLNHTHKEVVAEKLYSLSVGIFSSGGAPLPA